MSVLGRPSDYSEELAKEICETIATTHKGLRQLCREKEHWPHRDTIRRWLFQIDSFHALYARAKEQQVDWLAEEALEIAYDGSQDTIIDDKGKRRCDNEWVQRSRLKVDTIKWYASKLKPKKYGEKLQIEKEDHSTDPAILKAREKAKELMSDEHGQPKSTSD